MAFHFYKDGSYVGASSSNVDQSRADAIAARHGWTIGEAPPETEPPKRPLSRWSFMQILDEQGLISTIQARIDAMPAGDQKRRAQGKFKHQITFHHDAPEMRALKTMMEAADPEFDFDALWAAGEALEYGE